MPVYKDQKRKTWYVKYSVTTDGKRKQVLKRGFEKKSDALDWEASQRGKQEQPDKMKFSALADKYFAYNKPKTRTEETQTAMMKKYFTLYDVPLNRIKKADLLDWYIQFTAKDLKPSTMNLCIGIVRSVFKFGYDFYELPNPSAVLKRVKQQPRAPTVWSPDQFAQFLAVVDQPLFYVLFSFIYYTGVRKSEALSLRKGDFSDGSVHVRGTKTAGSDRVLTLAPSLCAILKPVLEALESDDDLVFPMCSATMHTYFQAYTVKSGLPPIRIHDLRHSFATNLIGSGANIVAVSKYLGHATIDQTLKTYAHLLKKADDEMVNMINGIIRVSQPSQST